MIANPRLMMVLSFTTLAAIGCGGDSPQQAHQNSENDKESLSREKTAAEPKDKTGEPHKNDKSSNQSNSTADNKQAQSFFSGIKKQSSIKACKVQIKMLEQATKLYILDAGKSPSDLKHLVAAPTNDAKAKWRGPYLTSGRSDPLQDPWGNQFIYSLKESDSPGPTFEISSKGPDGVAGTADDISTASQK